MRRAITCFFVAVYGIGLFALASCSSFESTVQNGLSTPTLDGVVYHMPRRPIQISVAIDKEGLRTPLVAQGEAVPDLTRRFVLSYSRNWVGTNHMNVVVNDKGLLTTSNTDTVSGVKDILQNFAKAAGMVQALAKTIPQPAPPKPSCASGSTYYLVLFPEQVDGQPIPTLCNYSITVARLSWAPNANADNKYVSDTESYYSGIFYKQNLPYLVTLTDNMSPDDASKAKTEFVAFSPDEAPISFVPVTRTLFSNNQANIGFTEGVLNSIDQKSDGEVVALSELPADVISAYFGAIGNLFSQLGTNASSQTTLVNNQTALALAQIKMQSCNAAIAANPLTGKTGDDLTNAVAAIKAACS